MKRCNICKSIIPKSRGVVNGHVDRVRFCSTQCIKKSYYIKNLTNDKRSIYKNYKDFLLSETGFGYKWELEGAKILGAKHLPFNNRGADLQWGNRLVDVKASNQYKIGNNLQWVFNRNGQKPVDYFLCFCLLDNKISKILLIPNKDFPKSGITVGTKSKYDKFVYKSV